MVVRIIFLELLLVIIIFCCLWVEIHCESMFYSYGKHYPNGKQAVDYVTGPDGTWKPLNPAEYIWNYYNYSTNPPNHPYDKSSLIAYADGTHFTTCRDANGHLLLDFNHDGELDTTEGKYAYFEHNGRGVNNMVMGNPFTNFWFDDNTLARYMNLAYNLMEPYGLSEYNDFTRWKIVAGDTTNWIPYSNPSAYPDQLALNGLYYLAKGDLTHALLSWQQILQLSQMEWNADSLIYVYPGIKENYHMSLWLTLSHFLLHQPSSSFAAAEIDIRWKSLLPSNTELLQHIVSIRSAVLSNQVINPDVTTFASGPFYGWTSSIGIQTSLMNTESMAMGVLSLGAAALVRYEVGRDPLLSDLEKSQYVINRPGSYLSARVDESQEGYLSYGPYTTLQEFGSKNDNSYTVEYTLRSPHLSARISRNDLTDSTVIARMDVYDSHSQTILAGEDITLSDLANSSDWKNFALPLTVSSGGVKLEFRLWWKRVVDCDLAFLSVY